MMYTYSVWTVEGWVSYVSYDMVSHSCADGDSRIGCRSNERVLIEQMVPEAGATYEHPPHWANLCTDHLGPEDAPEPYIGSHTWVAGKHTGSGKHAPDVIRANGAFESVTVLLREGSTLEQEVGESLANHPLLDDEDYYELRSEEMSERWASASIEERWHYIAGTGLSRLAARHDDIRDLYRRGARDGGPYCDDQGALEDAILNC